MMKFRSIFIFASSMVIPAILVIPTVCASGQNKSILILSLPQRLDSAQIWSWESQQVLLNGALLSTDIINNDSSPHSLELITADSGVITRYDDPYSGNVLQVIANLTWNNRLNHIIGIVGFIHPELLMTFQKFHIPIASLVHFGTLPNVTYLTASTLTLADSLLQFMQTINQTRFGLITELHNSYFPSVSQQLLAKTKNSSLISIKPYVQIGFRYVISNVVDEIAAANVRSIILSVHPSIAIQILCEAYKSNLKWPDYVWIMFGYQLDDLMLDVECFQNITEGILLFQLFPNELIELMTLAHSKSCWNYLNDTILSQKLQSENPLTYLSYNAILTLTVASQNKSSIDWENFHCSNNVVYVYQISDNGLQNRVGFYDGSLHMVTHFCQVFPCRDLDLPVVLKDFPLGYLMVLPSLCIITNTVLLVLYIYFRNEPSVKSTSISLSLLIFLACYFLSVFIITHIIHRSQRLLSIDLCTVHIWLNGIGLSLPLLLATMLVRMLRVYRIFTQHKILKPKVYTSTFAHFVYAFLIISPAIITLLFWTFLDPYHNDIRYSEHPGIITVTVNCTSKNEYVWYALLLIYTLLLSLMVVVIAIKSRKIRLKHFNDTKKVNLFIFLMFFFSIYTLSYCCIFWIADVYEEVPTYILYAGHLIVVFLCHIFLFIPKVWPSVRGRFLKQFIDHTHHDIQDLTYVTNVSKRRLAI